MNQIEAIVKDWYYKWDTEDYKNLPLSEDFQHTSPYGTVRGKSTYLDLVKSNKDKFLGNQFKIHDELYDSSKACVRYTIVNPAFTMEVSEWFYIDGELIKEIVAYYNIEGEISDERKLSNLE